MKKILAIVTDRNENFLDLVLFSVKNIRHKIDKIILFTIEKNYNIFKKWENDINLEVRFINQKELISKLGYFCTEVGYILSQEFSDNDIIFVAGDDLVFLNDPFEYFINNIGKNLFLNTLVKQNTIEVNDVGCFFKNSNESRKILDELLSILNKEKVIEYKNYFPDGWIKSMGLDWFLNQNILTNIYYKNKNFKKFFNKWKFIINDNFNWYCYGYGDIFTEKSFTESVRINPYSCNQKNSEYILCTECELIKSPALNETKLIRCIHCNLKYHDECIGNKLNLILNNWICPDCKYSDNNELFLEPNPNARFYIDNIIKKILDKNTYSIQLVGRIKYLINNKYYSLLKQIILNKQPIEYLNWKNFIETYNNFRVKCEYYNNKVNNKLKMYENVILIPYRDREENLNYYLDNTIPLIKKYLPNSKVVIIEQEVGKSFNRGKVLNIGFLEYKFNTKYFITNDIDINPSKFVIKKEFSRYLDKNNILGIITPNNTLGGLIKIRNETIHKINGFPNELWGWGAEDKILQSRSEFYKIKKINIHTKVNSEGNQNISNNYFTIFDHNREKIGYKYRNDKFKKFNNLKESQKKDDILNNGITTLEYKILNRIVINDITELIKVRI